MNESIEMQKYFDVLDKDVNSLYTIANKVRAKGYDPSLEVEVPLTRNMAERVEGLISVVAPQIKGSGIPARIQELEKEFGAGDWRVAMRVAEEVANEKFCKFENQIKAMETAIRIGLAYITVGVVASPLEGFVALELKDRLDGKGKYFSLKYSGPIRSAGGTAAAVSVVIADYVRIKKGFLPYDITENEIKRSYTEIVDYHERVTNLQYYPSKEEALFLIENLPVQIDGDPTEKFEVSNYKDLPRIDTNRVRGGICLVLAEALSQKAAKVWKQLSKWGKENGLGHWEFLDKFVKIQKSMKAKGEVKEELKITPDYTYIKDLVAGRPVLTYPLRRGGFRLRYGRTRITGFSADAIHPATMQVLEGYIATGTQLKVERPGKGTTVYPCDYIEGPIVKLKDKSVIYLDNEEEAKKLKDEIEEIIYLGDILINYGDFLNRAHKLVPVGYCEEWWVQEFKKALEEKKINLDGENYKFFEQLIKDPIKTEITIEQAINFSEKLEIPLHPKYTYHWLDITKEQLLLLLDWILNSTIERNEKGIGKIVLALGYTKDIVQDPKRALELIGVCHSVVSKEYVIIEETYAKALAANLGFFYKDLTLEGINKIKTENQDKKNVLAIVNSFSNVKLRDKSGICIGTRMGRPEKAKMRKLDGSPQVLFPVGKEGGKMRSFQSALDKGKVFAQFPIYYCNDCKTETIYPVCEKCEKFTEKRYYCRDCDKEFLMDKCGKKKTIKLQEKELEIEHKLVKYKEREIDINHYFKTTLKKLNIKKIPELIKGVRGTSNEDHTPENLAKGILRALHEIYVNKDGTVRYDMTESGITHFKPREIGTSIETLKKLGYEKDIYGDILNKEDQILEIKPQDVILPSCKTKSAEEGADTVLLRVTHFIDDLLVKFYGENSFYNLKDKKDLVGHLVLGLAPHTSAGIVGRIIGFSNTQCFFAHPMFHSIMRRDVDGDEACVVLLLDVLLNFSRKFLPNHRGATQDAPLVLTSKLIPTEIDDMVYDLDVVWNYPLELYEAALEFKNPGDVVIERLNNRLRTEKQYEGFGFTHNTSDINAGVTYSSYKSLPTMEEKVRGQMLLAEKIRAVDESDVARLVIERHFLRDIKGNLRKFSMQQFRCSSCNEKYRRPPLIGKCTKCDGRLIFTIAEGSITKYLDPSLDLAEKYDIPPYLRQTLELLQARVEGVFGRDKEKQEGLVKWFSK